VRASCSCAPLREVARAAANPIVNSERHEGSECLAARGRPLPVAGGPVERGARCAGGRGSAPEDELLPRCPRAPADPSRGRDTSISARSPAIPWTTEELRFKMRAIARAAPAWKGSPTGWRRPKRGFASPTRRSHRSRVPAGSLVEVRRYGRVEGRIELCGAGAERELCRCSASRRFNLAELEGSELGAGAFVGVTNDEAPRGQRSGRGQGPPWSDPIDDQVDVAFAVDRRRSRGSELGVAMGGAVRRGH
jgi:hypothetical protein